MGAIDIFTRLKLDKGEFEEGLDEASGGLFKFSKVGAVAGAAMVGAGAGLLAVTGRAHDLNAGLAAANVTTGVSTERLRELALEASNVTFSNDDAVRSINALAQAGVRTEDDIRALLPVVDAFSTATGKDAAQSASEMANVLQALGVPLTDLGEHVDKFTFLSQGLGIELKIVEKIAQKHGQGMQELGITFDEQASILEVLTREYGLSGEELERAFVRVMNDARTATEEKTAAAREELAALAESVEARAAAGESVDEELARMDELAAFIEANSIPTQEDLAKALDITAERFDAAGERVNEFAGATDTLAESQAASLTWWDKLKQSGDDLVFQYGTLLAGSRDVAVAMVGLGPVFTTLSSITWKKLIPSLYGAATAGWAMVAPFLPFILAAAAVIAVAFLLWKHWDKIWPAVVDVFVSAWGSITDFFLGVGRFFTETIPGWVSSFTQWGSDLVLGFLGGFKKAWEAFTGWLNDAWEGVKEKTKAIFGISSPSRVFAEYGRALVAGLEEGTRGLPDVVKHQVALASDLGDAPLLDLPAREANTEASGHVTHIHNELHVDAGTLRAADEDPDGLERLAKKLLDVLARTQRRGLSV